MVKTIGMQAFSYSDNLEQVTFEKESSLEIIDSLAFSVGNKLTYIRLPDKLRVIKGCGLHQDHVQLRGYGSASHHNIDLPEKLRRNTQAKKVRESKKISAGASRNSPKLSNFASNLDIGRLTRS